MRVCCEYGSCRLAENDRVHINFFGRETLGTFHVALHRTNLFMFCFFFGFESDLFLVFLRVGPITRKHGRQFLFLFC